MTISRSNPELEDEQEIPVSQVLGALCIAGSASRVVCVRCVRLRAVLPLEPCTSGKRGPQVQVQQVTLAAGFCVEEGLRRRATKQKPCHGISFHADSPVVSGFGCWHGCNLGSLGVRIHALTPRKICEPGLLSEG